MVDYDKICDFVEGAFGPNKALANATLLEMGIDPATRRPTTNTADGLRPEGGIDFGCGCVLCAAHR